MNTIRLKIQPLVVPVIIIAIWQATAGAGLIAGGLFPPPSRALGALWDWVFGVHWLGALAPPSPYDGTWFNQAGASIFRILSGFAIGSLIGVVLGALTGAFAITRRLLDPMINAIRPISVMAWIPLTLVFFGTGTKPAIVLTALATFFPVYVNTFDGAYYTDRNLLRAASMLGATRKQKLLRVTLPAALPKVAVGLRVAAALAWTTVVVAEILGAKSGLGFVLIDSYNQFRFDYIIAAMISLGFWGFLTDKLVLTIFRHPLRWVAKGAER